jgi:hypothetical protein
MAWVLLTIWVEVMIMANVSDKWIEGWLKTTRSEDSEEYATQILEVEAEADEIDTLGGYDED